MGNLFFCEREAKQMILAFTSSLSKVDTSVYTQFFIWITSLLRYHQTSIRTTLLNTNRNL